MAATSPSDAQSAASEGPVLTFLNKRIRALRKKLTRISQMEQSLSQGKSLNNEQQDVLRSKPGVVALIDELEKIRSPISAAVSEEISLALQAPPVNADPTSNAADSASAEEAPADSSVVEDLLNLLYFGNLFDVLQQSEFTSVMLTKTHERGCCLTYDCVTDDASATDLLVERDLDLISSLKGLVISRPVSSGLSHKNALHRCIEHAKLWLQKSDQPIDPQSSVTYVSLREKLGKIMSSEYYTTTPEMRGPAEMAAVAGVASFSSLSVPIHGSVVPVSIPTQVEESAGQYQQGVNGVKEGSTNLEEYETTGEHQSVPGEELQKDNLETGNSTEEVSFQADEEKAQAEDEQQPGEVDSTGQPQYMHRRPYPNHYRGGGRGGRRGYPNGRGGRGSGRGGGPYQNGPGQYYEQQGGGNYYPRNNNYRGRGGGRGNNNNNNGGGNSYYNQSSGVQGARPQSNVGVAS